jgi:hypothetical protein
VISPSSRKRFGRCSQMMTTGPLHSSRRNCGLISPSPGCVVGNPYLWITSGLPVIRELLRSLLTTRHNTEL